MHTTDKSHDSRSPRASLTSPRGLIAVLTAPLLATLLACGETVEPPSAPDAERASGPLASAALMVTQVNAGAAHNCALRSDNRAVCWGWNVFGQVGNGTTSFEVLSPTAVMGGRSFRQITAGIYHTCAVTMDNRAFCWGGAALGSGTASGSSRPVAVVGGLSFRQVSAGQEHTCGVTTSDRVYCWGINTFGQLGNGTQNLDFEPELSPVPVMGSLRFRGVSVGVHHSCGVTTTNQAYCWGGDQWGQLGDGAASGTCQVPNGTRPCRLKPTRVAGGHQWRQIDAGGGSGPAEGDPEPFFGGRTCGVTTDGRAFCWGDGTLGQNGDGTRSIRTAPSRVAGDRLYRAVSTGENHTCAVSTDNRAFCWGLNGAGQLGDGTQTTRLRPRAVVGGLLFDQVSAGLGGTCGRTMGGRAYCWGLTVGDGTNNFYLTPQPVGGSS
jgi:alpha-tubulin suppressor-like RCC1 family protein